MHCVLSLHTVRLACECTCVLFLWYCLAPNMNIYTHYCSNSLVQFILISLEIKTFVQQGSIKLIMLQKNQSIRVSTKTAKLFLTLIIIRFLEQPISISEWFLNDHMMLNTRVMILKIQLCITEINEVFTIYSKIKVIWNCFTVLLFSLYFWSKNAALGSIRDFFQKHKKINLKLLNGRVHKTQFLMH